MNILLLAPHPFFQNRGTPIAVKLLLTALSEQGHQVDVLTFPEGEDVILRNVRIFRVRKTFGIEKVPIGFSMKKVFYDGFLFFRALSLLRRGRYELVHAVEESAFIAMVAKAIYKTPYIFDMDSSIPDQILEKYPNLHFTHRLLRRVERTIIRRSAYVLTVCESLAGIARRWKDPSRVHILEDVPLFVEMMERKSLGIAESLGITGAIVMYVGNLEMYQGIDLLLDSFRIAHAAEDRHHLVIVGGGKADIDRYSAMAGRMGIGGHVHFLGPKPVEELPNYLAEADILVSPRIRGENTPMKIYSYMYSGKPVLATRMKTHTQVLNDENAVLAEPDPADFSKALLGLLADEKRRAAVGRRAAEDAGEKYSFPVYKRKLAALYEEVSRERYPARKQAARGTVEKG